jgi:pseudouridine synthase
MEERLQKLMARAGIGSRRQSEIMIADGRVTINGRVAQLGDRADPLQDTILLDGQPVKVPNDGPVYVALNKPRGVISSLEDELDEGRTTVRDLVPLDAALHIYPVGRLDRPSEGLILMTNDGELAHRLTHPRYGHEKVYEVTVEGQMPERILDQWRRGVMLDGRITTPAPIEVLERTTEQTRLRIILREGRKRQIRRVAASLGHPVRQLIRQRIGPIELGELKTGSWRYLTDREVAELRRGTGLDAPAVKGGGKA